MTQNEQAIGIFDSGLGGLTVMNEIAQVLPNEKLVYLGDTARLPYGDKDPEAIIRYTVENTLFLMEQGIKLLVIACNTATAYAINKLKSLFNIPIIGVIDPGVIKAVEVTKNNYIGILGTKGTIASRAYEHKILEKRPSATVISIACPLFVPLVEEGMQEHQATQLIIEEYLLPLKQHSIDTLLLGCTHYPILKPFIQRALGHRITIVDSATTCAHFVAITLKEKLLEAPFTCPQPSQFFVTDNPEKFQLLGKKFLRTRMNQVSKIKSLDLNGYQNLLQSR
ncbi:MAG: glutamate racemase [Parachlamydiaceae bacterium]